MLMLENGVKTEPTVNRIRVRILILLLLATGVASAPPARAQPAGDKSPLETIATRLGSADFAERSAAQDALEKIPYARLSELEALLNRQIDPEIKIRLDARLE